MAPAGRRVAGAALTAALALGLAWPWAAQGQAPRDPRYSPGPTPFTRGQGAGTSGGGGGASAGQTLPPDAAREERARKLFRYLRGEYQALLKSKDWVTRGLAVVCLARLPGTQTNDLLLTVMSSDPEVAVRMLAWQALLAQAPTMNEGDLAAMVKGTWPLVEKGAFRGQLRVALLDLMATLPPDARAKAAFLRIFAETNSTLLEDRPVIEALGRCLASWKSPDLAQALIERMSVLNDAWRAEMVLRDAGITAPTPAATRFNDGAAAMWAAAQREYAGWWVSTGKAAWQAERRGADEQAWRKLRPAFIPPSPTQDQVDPDDPSFRKDLELRRPDVRNFDAAFVVDATGSMQPILDYLRTDVKRVMRAMALVCKEPRIGLTFYRDHGDEFVVRSVALTGDVNVLVRALTVTKAKGGADVPEAVLDGVRDALKGNRWTENRASRKVMIIVGDAPPHAATQAELVAMVGEAAEKQGFRFYAVKARTQYGAASLPEFDAIAAAGKGAAVELDVEAGSGGTEMLTRVLTDVINPQFADRVEPLAATLLAMLTDPVPEVRQAHKPVKTEPQDPGSGRTPRQPVEPPKPFDPQAR